MAKLNIGDYAMIRDYEGYCRWYEEQTGHPTVVRDEIMVVHEASERGARLAEDQTPCLMISGVIPWRFLVSAVKERA